MAKIRSVSYSEPCMIGRVASGQDKVHLLFRALYLMDGGMASGQDKVHLLFRALYDREGG